jgi:hypothetical protein
MGENTMKENYESNVQSQVAEDEIARAEKALEQVDPTVTRQGRLRTNIRAGRRAPIISCKEWQE